MNQKKKAAPQNGTTPTLDTNATTKQTRKLAKLELVIGSTKHTDYQLAA